MKTLGGKVSISQTSRFNVHLFASLTCKADGLMCELRAGFHLLVLLHKLWDAHAGVKFVWVGCTAISPKGCNRFDPPLVVQIGVQVIALCFVSFKHGPGVWRGARLFPGCCRLLRLGGNTGRDVSAARKPSAMGECTRP